MYGEVWLMCRRGIMCIFYAKNVFKISVGLVVRVLGAL